MNTEKRVIGFGGVFYTEWNVETTTKIDAQGNGYACDRYTYLGNLSKDLETAKSKMRHAFEVDTDVKGEKYFTVNRRIVADLGLDTLFFFGKHAEKSIAYIHENDPSYLTWYAEKGEKDTPLFAIFARTSIGSQLIQSIEGRKKAIENAAKEALNVGSKWIEGSCFSFVAERNLSIGYLPDPTTLHYDYPVQVKHGVYSVKINDLIIQFFFADFNEHDYKGISYAYPTIKGKGKKIKTQRLNIEFTEISRSEKWIERDNRFERIQKVLVHSFTLEKVV